MFFFSSRRRHTRLQGDWSSDVCSSDLPTELLARLQAMLDAVRAALAAHPLGAQIIVAVEVRDPELLTPEPADTLLAAGAPFCLGLHRKMPPLEEPLGFLRRPWRRPPVCRRELKRGFRAYCHPPGPT